MKSRKVLREHRDTITYSEQDWALLKKKRTNAIRLLEIFVREGFNPFIHGSLARGDIHESSDIDIVFIHGSIISD